MISCKAQQPKQVLNNSSNLASSKGDTRNTSYCSVLYSGPGVSVFKSVQEAPACDRGERAGKPAETHRDKTIKWGPGSRGGVSIAFSGVACSSVTQEEIWRVCAKTSRRKALMAPFPTFGLEQYAKPLTSVLIWTTSPDLSRSSRMLLSTGPNYTSRPLALS